MSSKLDDHRYKRLQDASADVSDQKFVLSFSLGTQKCMTGTKHIVTFLTGCLKATLRFITFLEDLKKTFSLLLRRPLASKTLSLNLTS